jgi:hypothetical protein
LFDTRPATTSLMDLYFAYRQGFVRAAACTLAPALRGEAPPSLLH